MAHKECSGPPFKFLLRLCLDSPTTGGPEIQNLRIRHIQLLVTMLSAIPASAMGWQEPHLTVRLALPQILQNHIVPGVALNSTQLATQTAPLDTLAGQTLTVRCTRRASLLQDPPSLTVRSIRETSRLSNIADSCAR